MTFPKQSSPSNRYLLARLRVLTRPVVWGSVLCLAAIGVGGWYFLSNPNVLSDWQGAENAPTDTPLNPEDGAIGADIDNLPLLARELEQNGSGNLPGSALDPQVQSDGGLFGSLAKNLDGKSENTTLQSQGTPASRTSSPFSEIQDYRLLNVNSLNSTNTSTNRNLPSTFLGNPLLNSGSASPYSPVSPYSGILSNQTPASNPLRTAVEQMSSQSAPATGSTAASAFSDPLSSTNAPAAAPSIPSTTPGLDYSNTPTNLGFDPGDGLARSRTSNRAPVPYQAAPVSPRYTNVTPEVEPVSPNLDGYGRGSRGSTNIPTTGTYGSGSYGYSNNSGYPETGGYTAQPAQPQPAPFSVPRPIGNGRINTFSNP